MKIENYNSVYFIGIGGIGMSALARWFNLKSFNVAGYDRTPSSITNALQSEGIDIHFEDDNNKVPEVYKNAQNTLVIYTPAVPKNHTELEWFRSNGFSILKRAEILGLISNSYNCIAVAGTHGKTSVSTLITHLLHNTQQGINAFLGGVSVNFSSNLVHSSNSNVVVVEADEFDRSFLHLSPNIAVITHIDPDHLDIYGTFENIVEAFRGFASNISEGGKLFVNYQTKHHLNSITGVEVFTYSANNNNADYYAEIESIDISGTKFSVFTPFGKLHNLFIPQVGMHQIENAVVSVAVAMSQGVSEVLLKSALSTYEGVKRRYEHIASNSKLVYVDDYAHHPLELKVTIEAARMQYPEKHITGVFQPHLFTRTRDFADDFADVLSLLDELILLEIYPAREQSIEGVNSTMLLDKVSLSNKKLMNKQEVLNYIENGNVQGVLITMGAGDIDRLVEPLKNMLSK